VSEPIQDVTIIWVTDVQKPLPTYGLYQDGSLSPWIEKAKSGQPLNHAFTWRMPHWNPNESIDFATLNIAPALEFSTAMKKRYQTDESNRFFSNSGSLSLNQWRKKMEMLSLYSHLEPPIYQKNSQSKQSPDYFQTTRSGGHTLDFAEWFNKPCIIVMGFIPNSPIPIQISVDDEQISQSTGETFVRWIYPLRDAQ
jgi:hypothetical protein